jgi:oligosaccharyltransferase complex subunit gamma
LLVAGWRKNQQPCSLFFATLDFKDGQDVFRQMQLRSVPIILLYPPTEGPYVAPMPEIVASSQKIPEIGAPETYDLQRRGALAEDLAKWLETTSMLHPKIAIRRPLDYARILTTILVLGVLAATGKVVFKNFGGVFQAKALWLVLSELIIIVMISGYMWNQIRTPPYMGKTLWAEGFSSQYVAETQVMASMCTFFLECG